MAGRTIAPASRSVTAGPCRAGCDNFLYTLKRRLRAGRKRPVLAAETGAHGSPATPSPPQHGPAVPTLASAFPAWQEERGRRVEVDSGRQGAGQQAA
jgi:hypothetical protein